MGLISFSLDERLLAFLKAALPLELFVETGTFKGDTLAMARRYFDRCQSVELSPAYHQKARERFAADPGVELACGPSPDFLLERRALHQGTPTLFWLDAHWCRADEETGGADSQTPLLAELAAIERLHPDSVLLIDDAQLYLCPPPKPHRLADWPGWDEVVRALLPLSSAHRFMVYNDVVICYPTRLHSALSDQVQTYGANWNRLVRHAQRYEARSRWWRWGRKPQPASA